MKKSWFACLLAPCLTFAAYPNYEREFDSSQLEDVQIAEESEAAYVDQQRTVMGQRKSVSYDEENGVYDYDFDREESAVAPQKPLKREESSDRYTGQKQTQRSSGAKTPSVKRKQSASAGKRTPSRENPSAQRNQASKPKSQEARQNANRPRVMQRNQQEKRVSKQQVEVQAHSDAEGYYEESREEQKKYAQPSKAKQSKATSSQKRAPAQKNITRSTSQSGKARVNAQARKAQRDNSRNHQSSEENLHHPGRRPSSE